MANIKVVTDNRKARYNYEFLETYEAGIQLTGPEVKSIKSGHISINEAFATVKDEGIWLLNAHVSPYKPASKNNDEPTRSRKLLLNQKEVDHLLGKVQTEGLTLVPTKVYLSHGLVKIEIALARGKKVHDKREIIKKRDIDREMSRELKNK
ncbi:MAG: SsrA-binding protein SmpB [Patescibacteria group bacterium]|jgi:SsrA-binding protein|nr:SsrA-binding protein SmpB [Patescibacteria group bacterium]